MRTHVVVSGTLVSESTHQVTAALLRAISHIVYLVLYNILVVFSMLNFSGNRGSS
jgi:hypothetical protein